ncbi:MAG: Mur ligase domain-containing protein, partial [Burkholderiaceae bacterium]
MKATLSELLPQIPGATLAADAAFAGNTAFDGISTDSRQLAPGSLFVALRGERFDAHDFLGDVAAAPVAAIRAAAFGEDGRLATRGNFNNEIGLPLTL